MHDAVQEEPERHAEQGSTREEPVRSLQDGQPGVMNQFFHCGMVGDVKRREAQQTRVIAVQEAAKAPSSPARSRATTLMSSNEARGRAGGKQSSSRGIGREARRAMTSGLGYARALGPRPSGRAVATSVCPRPALRAAIKLSPAPHGAAHRPPPAPAPQSAQAAIRGPPSMLW